MSKTRFNSVPVAVQQMVESMNNPKTPEHVRFNQTQVVLTIKEFCEYALAEQNRMKSKATLFKPR